MDPGKKFQAPDRISPQMTHRGVRGNNFEAIISPNLIFKQSYQIMKTKLNLQIMILLATIVSLGCSGEKKKESRGVEDGYASPELLFEAMKGNELEFEIPLYPPADRNMVAYVDVELLSLMVTVEEDLDRQKEAEQAFSLLIEKHDLADRLEFTDNEDKKQTLADQAFEGVDLIAFLADVKSFMGAHGSSFFGPDDEGGKVEALSLKNLQIDGSDATATMIYSDDTERPAIFVREKGLWYLSFKGMYEDQIEGDWSAMSTLKITFSTDADLEKATTKSLLKDADYDRSMPPSLNKNAKDRVAYLAFMKPLDSEIEIGAIIDRVGEIPGVETVEATFGPEWEAESDEALKRALSSPIPSSAISMGCILKVTFATDDDLEHATAKSLLEGLSDDLSIEATLDKKAKDRVAYLAFMKPLDSEIEPILERVGEAPGVVEVDRSLGAEFEESRKRSRESESEADLEEQESPPTKTTPESEQPSPEPDAGTPDNFAEEAPADMIAKRVWTDQKNRTLTAALVSLDAGVGKFRRDNGEVFDYQVKKLSETDRKLIEEASREREAKVNP
jgi:hypothetical protein